MAVFRARNVSLSPSPKTSQITTGCRSALDALGHASSQRAVVRTEQPVPYTVDAELFPGVKRVSIEAGPELRFMIV